VAAVSTAAVIVCVAALVALPVLGIDRAHRGEHRWLEAVDDEHRLAPLKSGQQVSEPDTGISRRRAADRSVQPAAEPGAHIDADGGVAHRSLRQRAKARRDRPEGRGKPDQTGKPSAAGEIPPLARRAAKPGGMGRKPEQVEDPGRKPEGVRLPGDPAAVWRPPNRRLLDHVALQRELERQPGRQHRQERPEPGRVGVEPQPVAKLLAHHRHRPPIGRAVHHALSALAVRADAAPLVGWLVRQDIGLALALSGQKCPVRREEGGLGIIGRDEASATEGGIRLRLPPDGGARVRHLVVQPAQCRHVPAPRRAGDEEERSPADARLELDSRRGRQIVGRGRHPGPHRREDRRRGSGGKPGERRHCHRKTPSRQP
jgi:hypothetical protein